MWVSGVLIIAATLAVQEAPAQTEPAHRYGQLRAAVQVEMERRDADNVETPAGTDDWGFELYAARPRLSLAQRLENECSQENRDPLETESACRERVTEVVIQESLSRGDAARTETDWSEADEQRQVRAQHRNPMDRLRDCRRSSTRSQDGASSSWSIRCGDQDGPAAQALDAVLRGD
ncbi:MAG: hypothetical protein ACI8U3_002220 [Brevundimonas sp.]|jgi:hypothetical protein|uniref:hypothetical protein n=1 Tax=Brevundimonas sp. TaxID=1871086 RepID=UPI0039E345D3